MKSPLRFAQETESWRAERAFKRRCLFLGCCCYISVLLILAYLWT